MIAWCLNLLLSCLFTYREERKEFDFGCGLPAALADSDVPGRRSLERDRRSAARHGLVQMLQFAPPAMQVPLWPQADPTGAQTGTQR